MFEHISMVHFVLGSYNIADWVCDSFIIFNRRIIIQHIATITIKRSQ